ncbi:MAG TPA: hypothetical protein VGB85_00165 [Nannocystis sp.]|jgi:hypothetical protein
MRHAWLMIPLLVLAGCTGSDGGSGSAEHISLEVTFPPEVQPGPQATLVVTLYGYDPGFADASATVIQTDAVPLTATPGMFTIEFPTDAHERIDQGNGPVAFEDARYYFVFYGDLDDDRQICAGELFQDHDNDGPYDFGPGAPPETVTIPMRIVDASFPCRSAYPDGA